MEEIVSISSLKQYHKCLCKQVKSNKSIQIDPKYIRLFWSCKEVTYGSSSSKVGVVAGVSVGAGSALVMAGFCCLHIGYCKAVIRREVCKYLT